MCHVTTLVTLMYDPQIPPPLPFDNWLTDNVVDLMSDENSRRPCRAVDACQTAPLAPIGSIAQQRRCAYVLRAADQQT